MKIDFQFETPYGKFADALWFSDDQPIPSDAEVEAMKQQRLNNWIAAVTRPVDEQPVDVTTEPAPQE